MYFDLKQAHILHMSPVGAHGGNCGIESAAALAHFLYEQISHGECHNINERRLERGLRKYYEMQIDRARLFCRTVHFATRLSPRDGLRKSLLASYLLPRMDMTQSLCTLLENAERFNFLPEPARAKGFVQGKPTESSETRTKITKWIQ